jgi:hypothetical protein
MVRPFRRQCCEITLKFEKNMGDHSALAPEWMGINMSNAVTIQAPVLRDDPKISL